MGFGLTADESGEETSKWVHPVYLHSAFDLWTQQRNTFLLSRKVLKQQHGCHIDEEFAHHILAVHAEKCADDDCIVGWQAVSAAAASSTNPAVSADFASNSRSASAAAAAVCSEDHRYLPGVPGTQSHDDGSIQVTRRESHDTVSEHLPGKKIIKQESTTCQVERCGGFRERIWETVLDGGLPERAVVTERLSSCARTWTSASLHETDQVVQNQDKCRPCTIEDSRDNPILDDGRQDNLDRSLNKEHSIMSLPSEDHQRSQDDNRSGSAEGALQGSGEKGKDCVQSEYQRRNHFLRIKIRKKMKKAKRKTKELRKQCWHSDCDGLSICSKKFQCSECNKLYKTRKSLRGHLVRHFGVTPHNCEFCPKGFYTKAELDGHRNMHTGDRPHVCQVCPKKFARLSNLHYHMKEHTGQRPFECDFCGKGFKAGHQLLEHSRVHTGETPFKCHLCDKAYKFRSTLAYHLRGHERPDKRRARRTGLPDEEAVGTRSDLDAHLRDRSAERPFKCEVCKKAMKTRQALERHTSVHTGERPFKCQVCEKSFIVKQCLTAHMRAHTGEKPFKCHLCEKAYRIKSSLNYHMKTHDTITQTPVSNTIVDSSRSGTVEEGKDTDTGKEQQSRSGYRNRLQHSKTQTGKRQFRCSVCQKFCSTRRALQRHQKIRHKKKTFECMLCGKAFRKESKLTLHLKCHTSKWPSYL